MMPSIQSRTLCILLSWLLVACAGTPRPGGLRSPTGVTYTEPVVLFVSPDTLTLERLSRGRGEDFSVMADDEMWYRSEAYARLDSLRIPYQFIERQPLCFQVEGETREYAEKEMPEGWFVVLYNGQEEPLFTHSVALPEELERWRRVP